MLEIPQPNSLIDRLSLGNGSSAMAQQQTSFLAVINPAPLDRSKPIVCAREEQPFCLEIQRRSARFLVSRKLLILNVFFARPKRSVQISKVNRISRSRCGSVVSMVKAISEAESATPWPCFVVAARVKMRARANFKYRPKEVFADCVRGCDRRSPLAWRVRWSRQGRHGKGGVCRQLSLSLSLLRS